MSNANSIVGKLVGKGNTVSNVLSKSYNAKHYKHELKEGLLHEEEETLEYEAKESKRKKHKC